MHTAAEAHAGGWQRKALRTMLAVACSVAVALLAAAEAWPNLASYRLCGTADLGVTDDASGVAYDPSWCVTGCMRHTMLLLGAYCDVL